MPRHAARKNLAMSETMGTLLRFNNCFFDNNPVILKDLDCFIGFKIGLPTLCMASVFVYKNTAQKSNSTNGFHSNGVP